MSVLTKSLYAMRNTSLKQLGAYSFVFFLAKGLLWLVFAYLALDFV